MKYSVKLTKRAYMKANVTVEANSPEEARAKVAELRNFTAKNVMDADGQLAESVHDIKWTYDEMDETDEMEIHTPKKV